MKVCIIGASGKLGPYMVEHALSLGYEVVAVCCSESVTKLSRFADRIIILRGVQEVLAIVGCRTESASRHARELRRAS